MHKDDDDDNNNNNNNNNNNSNNNNKESHRLQATRAIILRDKHSGRILQERNEVIIVNDYLTGTCHAGHNKSSNLNWKMW